MAFDFPEKFLFADTHEYVNSEAESVRIGISAFAVDQLGDIVFVDLPDQGSSIEKGTSFGSVESVKAVEDIHAPISGEDLEINSSLLDNPESLQNDPHGTGWLLLVRPTDPNELNELMSSASYSQKVASQ